MASDDYLTLPLPDRIALLRVRAGSHDKLGAALGTARQTVINWEKGAEPSAHYRRKLAAWSGWPEDAFRRTEAERETWLSVRDRLEALEAMDARQDSASAVLQASVDELERAQGLLEHRVQELLGRVEALERARHAQ